MTSTLREKAKAAARPEPAADQQTLPVAPDNTELVDEPLEDIEYSGPLPEWDQVPVQVALARVMADVQSVRKGDQRNDVGGKYAFRGVDRVVNAVGPALRRHGVLVVPVRIFDVEYREARTSKGTVMQDCTLKVEWAVFGPQGDSLPMCLQSTGQANDTGDKSTAKAVSVAQRVLFLTLLHIPTEDPTIDHGHDRGEAPAPDPKAYRDEILSPRTSLGRLQTIRGELRTHNFGGVAVINESGDEEPLWDLVNRIGRERSAAGGAG